MGLVRIVACGSVDDGKSTLIDRLLAQTGSVPVDQLAAAGSQRRSGSAIPHGELDYTLLTDGLTAEREQGITIDVAHRHLILPGGGRAILADAPGHEQYTRNMAVAASTADAALLLADASRGVTAQTMRHLTICALMGVARVVIAVNKLDCVGYDRAVFQDMAEGLSQVAARLGHKQPGNGAGQRAAGGQRCGPLTEHRLVRRTQPAGSSHRTHRGCPNACRRPIPRGPA